MLVLTQQWFKKFLLNPSNLLRTQNVENLEWPWFNNLCLSCSVRYTATIDETEKKITGTNNRTTRNSSLYHSFCFFFFFFKHEQAVIISRTTIVCHSLIRFIQFEEHELSLRERKFKEREWQNIGLPTSFVLKTFDSF